MANLSGALRWRLKPQHRLTEEQYMVILEEASRKARDWMLLFTPGNTGLRISEVLHLRVSDFDRATGIQIIRRKKKVLERDTLAVARELYDYFDQYVAEEELDADDWLFPGRCGPCYRKITERGKVLRREKLCTGGHLTIRRVQAIWDKILERANLKMKGRGIHTLRHYDLTRFYRVNKDLRATQLRAGHSSPITTTIYADVVEMEEKAQAAGVSASTAPWKRKGGPRRGRKPSIRD